MPDEDLATKRAQEALRRLLRPRGELVMEKRAMAQSLAQNLGQEKLSNPIFLVDPDEPISASDALDEKQKRFIEAVQKNVKLQKELSTLRAEQRAGISATTSSPASSSRADAERRLLEEQLECSRLEKEHRKLEAFKRFYEELNSQPAAAPEFMDPKIMFRKCAPFPELPKDLVEGFTKNEETPHQEAEELVLQLRKATFREKLILEHEQQRLNEMKAIRSDNPETASPEAQVAALNAVKTSLVDWIETMLSKAGEGESEEAKTSPVKYDEFENQARATKQADIKKQYESHIELRKQIMASITQLREPKILAQSHREEVSKPAPAIAVPTIPEPQAYLLTPYLEKLQTLSQEQKGLVQEKAHINSTLARQQQETNKALRRLATDSQLLSKYPQPKPEKSLSGLSFAKATKSASITDQIQPWLFAADSAKIVTLEAVAEAVDKGQMSIEDAMQALYQVSMLQNKGPLQVADEGNGASSEERTGKKSTGDKPKSIWSILDGNLGLINE
ncbi:hypothetical protein NPX13_g1328 [Xylaria arbuscula]|uniref:Uncharacterized protein n=1 Tax=Xylaria arbuscula TaxID=114810 RepID=A0A9W8TRW8_9PEZI|nr:hypothetical protein NPX13_g1328 [Xylaria arbuscula]